MARQISILFDGCTIILVVTSMFTWTVEMDFVRRLDGWYIFIVLQKINLPPRTQFLPMMSLPFRIYIYHIHIFVGYIWSESWMWMEQASNVDKYLQAASPVPVVFCPRCAVLLVFFRGMGHGSGTPWRRPNCRDAQRCRASHGGSRKKTHPP